MQKSSDFQDDTAAFCALIYWDSSFSFETSNLEFQQNPKETFSKLEIGHSHCWAPRKVVTTSLIELRLAYHE